VPEYQPVSSVETTAIERPGCPKCQHNRMLLWKLEAGPSGAQYRTFECQKCGRVQRLASNDPMNADARGWFAGELRRPT